MTKKLISRVYKKPVFLGEVADKARDQVLRDSASRDLTRTIPEIRRATAEAVCGEVVQVVKIGSTRALHTGPFPLRGFNVLESVIVDSVCRETGAVRTVRPAAYR